MKLSCTSTLLLAAVSALVLTACDQTADQPQTEAQSETPERSATAALNDRDGNVVGTVSATQGSDALQVRIDVEGLPLGTHGAHIHEIGDCSAGDFTSAGGHWNPLGFNHGMNAQAPNPHPGDLTNIEIAENGKGTMEAESSGNIDDLMDADGAAFVIHADPDDYVTQPTGNAGARIACGVFSAG